MHQKTTLNLMFRGGYMEIDNKIFMGIWALS
uniref:Uncharacterized protein n=1 Tax=virus sp. ctIVh9 TaxID=2826797 RepID=A0A8S5R8D4_9VIRU|nr:MAG TPA: hypothetical protein [virus sp. ctIVh9]